MHSKIPCEQLAKHLGCILPQCPVLIVTFLLLGLDTNLPKKCEEVREICHPNANRRSPERKHTLSDKCAPQTASDEFQEAVFPFSCSESGYHNPFYCLSVCFPPANRVTPI